eukprot:3775755-Heterocapsa_arctica.AAC.1
MARRSTLKTPGYAARPGALPGVGRQENGSGPTAGRQVGKLSPGRNSTRLCGLQSAECKDSASSATVHMWSTAAGACARE